MSEEITIDPTAPVRQRRWTFGTVEVDAYGNEVTYYDGPKGENLTDTEVAGIVLSDEIKGLLVSGFRPSRTILSGAGVPTDTPRAR